MNEFGPVIEPMRKGMTVSFGYDEMTGETTEPVVGMGHSPFSPFADDTPFDLNLANADDVQTPDDTITEALFELYGNDIDPIVAYMDHILTDEQQDMYSEAIDKADWDYALPILEDAARQYYEAVQNGMTVTKSEDDGEGDEADFQYAMEILEQAATTEGAERDILMMSAEYHAGRAEFDDVLNQMVSKYGLETAQGVLEKWNL